MGNSCLCNLLFLQGERRLLGERDLFAAKLGSKLLDLLNRGLNGELERTSLACGLQTLEEGRIFGQRAQPGGQRRGIVGREQKPVLVVAHDFRGASGPAADHDQAGGHRLDLGDSKGLGKLAGEDQDVAAGVERGDADFRRLQLDPMLQSLGDLLLRATRRSRVVLELWDEDHREVEIASCTRIGLNGKSKRDLLPATTRWKS